MSPSRSLGLKGLRMVVVYLVGMCFAQNRKVVVRLARSNVLKGGGRGGGGVIIVEQLLQVLTGFWNLRKPCQHSLLLVLNILLILV